MKIILSIKPEFVRGIFSGKKKYEYRKTKFTKNVDSVIIYSTMPIGKFVGEFKIERIEIGRPIDIWEKTKDHSGITKKFFDDYFKGKENSYALKISDVKKYNSPIDPSKIVESFVAPQSFRYLNEKELERWRKIIISIL